MDKKRVGVLRGGREGDYYNSLREGGEIIAHIFENLAERWKVVDIFIDRDGVWHLNGLQVEPKELPEKVDLVWNTAHHSLVNTLEELSIPTINISALNSLLQNDSEVLAEHVKDFDLNVPKKLVLPTYQTDFDGPLDLYVKRKAKEVLEKFSAPWIVRTFTTDASMGVHFAKTFPELMSAIADGVAHNKSILVEEFIYGRNIDTHSVGGFRGEDIYVFPCLPAGRHQAGFSAEEKDVIIQMARELYQHLGVEHYLKSTFVIHPKRGIFITEMSFSPDLKIDSHFHKICESVGAKMHHIVEHILDKVASRRL